MGRGSASGVVSNWQGKRLRGDDSGAEVGEFGCGSGRRCGGGEHVSLAATKQVLDRTGFVVGREQNLKQSIGKSEVIMDLSRTQG